MKTYGNVTSIHASDTDQFIRTVKLNDTFLRNERI